ncbi:hypothetical protein T12_7379 [Trichinella patagoniensis]|uniref:Uncharacterized protein n=1 Tax=Trichinella patagoniensis TaxID=990121 RepID=A0A0V0ZHT2_9BILA|nr:hypothetical protein T12_7379 [Trichinella patagoniensis]
MDPSDTKSPILFSLLLMRCIRKMRLRYIVEMGVEFSFQKESSSDGRAELTRAPVCDECLSNMVKNT